jgi:DNA-binding CsgD family transcriptional regulator
LFGLTRGEALRRPGTNASLFFLYQEPIFGFTSAQQELLGLVLRGQSDADAAHALDISPSTVKKHWEAILERVARIQPDWLPPESTTDEGKRGVEKRRHLLSYLRQHLEELRPIA